MRASARKAGEPRHRGAERGDLASAADDMLRRSYWPKVPTVAIGNAGSLQGAGAFGQADNMIALFTDFGLHGPYTGQMKAVLHQMAPGIPIVDLPPGRPRNDGADRQTDWPDDLCEVVYVDHFDNAMTGLRAAMLPPGARLAWRVGCWSAREPSAIGRQARPSGTRIRTGLPKSRSIRGARTAISASRSAFPSRSSFE